ncbi:MAG: hypothetical protein AAF772_18590, partial [Acidobacteriota bacterium]
MKHQALYCSFVLGFGLMFFLLTARPGHAATITADGTLCTLADAIVAANTDAATGGCPAGDPGADRIELDADVVLSAIDPLGTVQQGGGAGLPDVTDDLTIAAGSADTIQRDPAFTCDVATGDPTFRFLNLAAGALTLEGVHLADGCFVGLAPSQGGGMLTAAGTDLTLTQVRVSNHGTFVPGDGLVGGFIAHFGDALTVLDTTFTGVTATAAGLLQGGVIYGSAAAGALDLQDVAFETIDAQATGSTLQGGALFAAGTASVVRGAFTGVTADASFVLTGGAIHAAGPASALFTLDDTTFTNVASTAAGGNLSGGAVYVDTPGTLDGATFSVVDAVGLVSCLGGALHIAASGASILERVTIDDAVCRSDFAAQGGGLHIAGSSVAALRDSAVRNSRALYGQMPSVRATFGQAGRGGGLYVGGAIGVIERSAFLDNQVAPSVATTLGDAQGGGAWLGAVGVLRNVTIAGNVARAGSGAALGTAGGDARGGGLAIAQANGSTAAVAHLTASANRAIAGAGAPGFPDGVAVGGGVYVVAGDALTIDNSILSGNEREAADGTITDDDCFADGTFTSAGHNLAVVPDASCAFSAFGDVVNVDPQLYPVADYGCTTTLLGGGCVPTAAIDQTSFAVDQGSCGVSGTNEDARAFARRQDIVGVPNLADTCDTGAFEAYDSDGDGITDVPDLCPMVADPDQSDSDGDDIGDACDACEGDNATGDTDSDMVCDDRDVCPGFDDNLDGDSDMVPDGCDQCAGNDATGDDDGDDVCNDLDACAGDDATGDTDMDGVCNDLDACTGDDATGDDDGDDVCNDLDVCTGDDATGDDDGDDVCNDLDVCTGDDATG